MTVMLGIESLIQDDFAPLQGKHIALMTNPSAVTRQLQSTYDIFSSAEQIQLTALFGPEHGFAAAAQDGVSVESAIDTQTGMPIYSLYGTTKQPTEAMLANIDLMVCDIQDIGVRYYTYLWTITHIMEACATHNIPVMILDRPNPLGAKVVGRGLETEHASLVGRYDIPIQHGMTLGEIASYINHECSPSPCQLIIIPCENYNVNMTWAEAKLPFVVPSPNMPHIQTVLQYPGACLIEGTSLSEGRGTTLPFEVVGAPEIDGRYLAQELNTLGLAAVHFREHSFSPITSKHQGKTCYGIQAHITDPEQYQAIKIWVHVLVTIQKLFPNAFTYLDHHLDRLIGTSSFREGLLAGLSADELMLGWDTYCEGFKEKRQTYRFYEAGR